MDGATTVSATVFAAAGAGIEVVAAGAKSILDLPRTLEVLETLGVPVVGLGTRHFPAFYVRSSGLVLDKHAERTADIARFCHIHWRQLRQRGGVLVACPALCELSATSPGITGCSP